VNILVLEPYYGGSHKTFLQGLMGHLPYTFDLLSLPARKWKWRMRLAAPLFAEALQAQSGSYERIICSSFVDVAAFRALAPEYLGRIPVCTYFHENQFDYPVERDDARDVHFALTNLTTALASDRLAFNSMYNLESFLAGADRLLRMAPDMKFADYAHRIRDKSTILYPGLDFVDIDAAAPRVFESGMPPGVPVVVWNHRWEYDKDPVSFFESLFALDHDGIDFRLIVLGKSHDQAPAIMEQARQRLAHRILHFGYVASRLDYCRLLRCGDIVVSTARHEFFGMAVLEAVRAGCRPLLPNRLSYRELFDPEFLFPEDGLQQPLAELLLNGRRLGESERRRLTDRFAWPSAAALYEQWLI
jgi:glycosyltransferase involved in cell wall biosynthesis